MKKHEALIRQAEIARVKSGSWWGGFWTGALFVGLAMVAVYLVLP